MKKKYIIIVPTHSSYIDVCENFISVLHKNWSPENYICILSICGPPYSQKLSSGWMSIYNGERATLPECVYKASQAYPSDYYFVFLGDAFIDNPVDGAYVEELLNEVKSHKIAYCKLEPQGHFSRTKTAGNLIRYIRMDERYAHSFVAYLASGAFIQNEFANGLTDREFELKYLEYANNPGYSKVFYEDRAIVLRNGFSIMAGIEKGMWDRTVLCHLKNKYKDIDFAERAKVGIIHQLYIKVRLALIPFIPNQIRLTIKNKMMIHLGKWIDTKI